MNKKGQGLSLNVVIIAIIVLVVLVVLVMVFTGYFSKWTPAVASCANQGGQCVASPDDCTTAFGDAGRHVLTQDCKVSGAAGGSADTPNEDAVCCIAGQ